MPSPTKPTTKIKLDGSLPKNKKFWSDDLAAFPHEKHPPVSAGRSQLGKILPGGWWLWCLIGSIVGLSAWTGGRHHLRTKLATQLATAETEQTALQSIQGLLQLDGESSANVVLGLNHPKFMVANAAFRVLNQQLDAWKSLAPETQCQNMLRIVSQLKQIESAVDDDHRILVSGLASRIYAESLSNRSPGAADLLSQCKQLLQFGPQSSPPTTLSSASISPAPLSSAVNASQDLPAAMPLPPVTGSVDGSASGQSRALVSSMSSEPRLQRAADLESPVPPPLPPLATMDNSPSLSQAPLASLSIASSSTPSSSIPSSSTNLARPRVSTATERGSTSSGHALVHLTASPTTRLSLSDTGTTKGETADSGPSALADEPAESFNLRDDGDASANETVDENDRGSTTRIDDPSVRADQPELENALSGIDSLPIEQLVRLLASQQPRLAQASSLALRRKGMNDEQLTLAMNLANGSLQTRQELLQSLARRDDLDPRPWILWMAADGDAVIREQAVGLLQPLLDAELRRQLRLLLSKESDERVATALRRVLFQSPTDPHR